MAKKIVRRVLKYDPAESPLFHQLAEMRPRGWGQIFRDLVEEALREGKYPMPLREPAPSAQEAKPEPAVVTRDKPARKTIPASSKPADEMVQPVASAEPEPKEDTRQTPPAPPEPTHEPAEGPTDPTSQPAMTEDEQQALRFKNRAALYNLDFGND